MTSFNAFDESEFHAFSESTFHARGAGVEATPASIWKLNSSLELQWKSDVPYSSLGVTPKRIVVDSNDRPLVTIPNTSSKVVIALDAAGSERWVSSISGNNQINDIVVGPSDEVFISANSAFPGEAKQVWKIDSSGSVAWSRLAVSGKASHGIDVSGSSCVIGISPHGPSVPFLLVDLARSYDSSGTEEWTYQRPINGGNGFRETYIANYGARVFVLAIERFFSTSESIRCFVLADDGTYIQEIATIMNGLYGSQDVFQVVACSFGLVMANHDQEYQGVHVIPYDYGTDTGGRAFVGTTANIPSARGVAVDSSDRILVAMGKSGSHGVSGAPQGVSLMIVDQSGTYIDSYDTGGDLTGVCVDSEDNIYVCGERVIS